MEMLWWPFWILCGNAIIIPIAAMSIEGSTAAYDPEDDSEFIRSVGFMFPENFLSRYPHEADSWRLKIFVYLMFNLLVKGYGSIDPSTVWEGYNRDDFNRVLIDAVFYEYLANFTESKKDLVLNPLENDESTLSNPVSNEKIAVDRIGQYLNLASGNKSRIEITMSLHDVVSAINKYQTVSEHKTTECNGQYEIQTKGTPGMDYPNFYDIPKTSFSCAGRGIPGIYADYETGCQAFHICWPRRHETFLCPIGTIFNQSHIACDTWHETACFSSPSFPTGISSELYMPNYDGCCRSILSEPLKFLLSYTFTPTKCEVKDAFGRKIKPYDKDVGDLEERLKSAHNLIQEMLQMLTQVANELEKLVEGNPGVRVLFKPLEYTAKLSTETDENTGFTKKRGETVFQPLKFEPASYAQLQSRMKPGLFVKSSTPLQPSASFEDHFVSSEKRDVPEIVMKSLKLGGTILNEGVIPLAKQIMIDSYRKIESKMR